MVKRAVKHQHPQQPAKGQAIVMPGIHADGQIQQRGRCIHSQQFFTAAPHSASGRFFARIHTGQHEPAGHQQEKGHRQARDYPGQQKIGFGVDGFQWRDMDGHHQQRRDEAKGIRPHRVSTNPSTLLPETV